MPEIPYSKIILLPELGDGASITMVNPWMLPKPAPLPKGIEGDALEAELETRMRAQLAQVILAWTGIVDLATGEPLPIPKDAPDSYDKCAQIVHLKVRQAMMGTKPDEPWDPTWRPPVVAETNEASAKVSASPENSNGSSTETATKASIPGSE